MLIPVSDDDSKLEGPFFISIALLALNILVFFFLQGAGSNGVFTYGWSVIPYEIFNGVDLVDPVQLNAGGRIVTIPQEAGPPVIYLTILSAMFMHGGLGHLFGNLLYLWIFADNLEHKFGHGLFLGFYLFCGVVATFVQVLLDPSSVIPNLGASGAISGIIAAEAVLSAKKRGDFSEASLADYRKALDASYVIKDMKTFQDAVKLLHNPSMFSSVPDVVCDFGRQFFTVGDGEAKKARQMFTAAVKRNASFWELAKLGAKAAKAL